jgi:hypothetical protein
VKKYFDWTVMGGAMIFPRSLRTTRNEKSFQDRPKFFEFLKSNMTLKYLIIIDFPKFDPLTSAEMASCGNLGPKCHNLLVYNPLHGFFLLPGHLGGFIERCS